MNTANTKIKGTGVAIVTPFRKDDSIDFKALAKLVDYQINNNIDYIVVLGTTGEPATLNNDEKHAIINTVIESVNKRVPILVGIGGNHTQETIHKIKSFDFTNIDGVLSVAPYYNRPTQAGIFEHFKAISSVCPLPLIVYNVPSRTAVNMTSETTLKLAHEFENIVAVKEASGNMVQIMEILRDKPKNFQVISGDDALTFPMICMGCTGVISVVANAFPKEFSEMVSLALTKKYDHSAAIHFKMLDIIATLFEEGSPSGVKAALEIKGLITNHVRLPLVNLSISAYQKLEAQIRAFEI